MSTVLVILHVLVCFVLIGVVLLQRGKGAEIGAVFGGGGSSTVFGSRGAGNFLTKLTTGSAVVFMATSLSLSYFWTTASDDRLFEGGAPEEAPAEAPAVPGGALFEEIETVPAQPAAEAAPPSPAAEAAPVAEGALPPLEPPPVPEGS